MRVMLGLVLMSVLTMRVMPGMVFKVVVLTTTGAAVAVAVAVAAAKARLT